MNTIENLAVIGGDERQLYMSDELSKKGFAVSVCGFDKYGEKKPCFVSTAEEALFGADAVILPVPASRDGVTVNSPFSSSPVYLDKILELTAPEQTVFAGMMKRELRSEFFKRGVRIYDYGEHDEFAIKNAIPTAEGVVLTVIGNTPATVRGSNICVVGYGRTGRAIANALRALGADVTVAARKCGSLALAENDGHRGIYISDIKKHAHSFDVLVNTVPAPVIGEDVVFSLKKSCLAVETASAPYGIDAKAAEKMNIHLIVAASLPGKYAPKTAGKIISDTILNIIREGSE